MIMNVFERWIIRISYLFKDKFREMIIDIAIYLDHKILRRTSQIVPKQ